MTLCQTQKLHAGIVVLSPLDNRDDSGRVMLPDMLQDCLRSFQASGEGLVIACTSSDRFLEGSRSHHVSLSPDICVFDETFTRRQVPFGAFSASPEIYAQWMAKGMSTFHSTTYQPNTISTMHFLKCLEEVSPVVFLQLQPLLKPLLVDHERLRKTFRDLFNPALARLISAAGFEANDVTASGHYVRVGEKSYFDGVGGVACSLRGHNPDTWVSEIEAMSSAPMFVTKLLDGCIR